MGSHVRSRRLLLELVIVMLRTDGRARRLILEMAIIMLRADRRSWLRLVLTIIPSIVEWRGMSGRGRAVLGRVGRVPTGRGGRRVKLMDRRKLHQLVGGLVSQSARRISSWALMVRHLLVGEPLWTTELAAIGTAWSDDWVHDWDLGA